MITIEDDLGMIENHEQWPVFPLLPLKRYNPEKKFGRPITGVLYAMDEKLIVYVGVSIFELGVDARLDPMKDSMFMNAVELKASIAPDVVVELRKRLDEVKEKIEYESISKLLADGWVVD